LELTKLRQEEYKSLSRHEKETLVSEYQPVVKPLPRTTAQSRCADLSHTVKNMQSLVRTQAFRVICHADNSLQMSGLKTRIGIEGFFCIVRSKTNFHVEPRWYFTMPALEEFLPIAVRKGWQTTEVGAKLEAFAIAGCDVGCEYLNDNYMQLKLNCVRLVLMNTGKKKAQMLKMQIRDMINADLGMPMN